MSIISRGWRPKEKQLLERDAGSGLPDASVQFTISNDPLFPVLRVANFQSCLFPIAANCEAASCNRKVGGNLCQAVPAVRPKVLFMVAWNTIM